MWIPIIVCGGPATAAASAVPPPAGAVMWHGGVSVQIVGCTGPQPVGCGQMVWMTVQIVGRMGPHSV